MPSRSCCAAFGDGLVPDDAILAVDGYMALVTESRDPESAEPQPASRAFQNWTKTLEIHRGIQGLKWLASRYDKTAESFLGFIDITSSRLWVRLLPMCLAAVTI